jgi:hypothetical protein
MECCAVYSGTSLPTFQKFYCLYHKGDDLVIALMMEAASTSETSVNFYQTTRATFHKTIIFILAAVRT